MWVSLLILAKVWGTEACSLSAELVGSAVLCARDTQVWGVGAPLASPWVPAGQKAMGVPRKVPSSLCLHLCMHERACTCVPGAL